MSGSLFRREPSLHRVAKCSARNSKRKSARMTPLCCTWHAADNYDKCVAGLIWLRHGGGADTLSLGAAWWAASKGGEHRDRFPPSSISS